MFKHILISLVVCIYCLTNYASPTNNINTTKRIPQFSNDKVSVWQTIIYPSSKQILTMHRHDQDRIVVALTNGLLKITNDKGKIHFLKLEKDKAYYLPKDTIDELHNDQNMSGKAIKVLVIELKN
jgi:hypothetical protein